MGIGTAIIGGIGAAMSWLGAGGIVAGMVKGALIGAAIGGLSAAVTGGSIGKGILFGAVGGAVTGGLTAWAAGAGGGIGGGPGALAGGSAGGDVASLAAAEAARGAAATGGTIIERGLNAAGSLMQSGGGEMLGQFVTKATEVLMAPEIPEDYSKSKEYLDKKLETDLERQRIASAAGGKGGSRGGGGHDPANMAQVALKREQWQYDVSKAEQMEKQRTEAVKSIRKGQKYTGDTEKKNTESTITTLDKKRAAEREAKGKKYITPITPPASTEGGTAPALTPPEEIQPPVEV